MKNEIFWSNHDHNHQLITRYNTDTTNIEITLSESKFKENGKDSNDIDDNPTKRRKKGECPSQTSNVDIHDLLKQ